MYLIVDVYSRMIVGWAVHEIESADLASSLILEASLRHGVDREELILHSDNGGPMKGATMLATLQWLGIVPSFSRPSVSDDNAYSEALFKTLKYRPEYPSSPFESMEAAQGWVEGFVQWYNYEHRRVMKRIRYGGPTLRIKIVKGVYWRAGDLAIQPVSEDVLMKIDSGQLFLTNKRLIFMGSMKNKVIRLQRILDFNAYKNGVDVQVTTGKSPFIEFSKDVSLFCMILGRVLRELD